MNEIKRSGGPLSKNENEVKWVGQIEIANDAKWVGWREYLLRISH